MFGKVFSCQLSVVSCRLSGCRPRRGTDNLVRRLAWCDGQDCPSHARCGISLTEVLIAMGILAVGLLGVASLFPVGGFYMQKAETADRGSAIAQSVMSEIVSRGVLNPTGWYVATPFPLSGTVSAPNYVFTAVDGKYTPMKAPIVSTFTRPFTEALSTGMRNSNDPNVLAKQFGNAYVIDPMFAASAATTTASALNAPAYPFPASAYAWPNTGTGNFYSAKQWDTWRPSSTTGGNNQRTWPIRRVTLQQSGYRYPAPPPVNTVGGWPLDAMQAEHLCRVSDDLSTDFPPRADRPSAQNWEFADLPNVGRTPMGRGSKGDYSWIVCVVPTTSAARDGLARNPEGFTYEVSVVVFHKRVLPAAPATSGPEMTDVAGHERAVSVSIISTGLNGGEVLLTDMDYQPTSPTPNSQTTPFDQLKTGQWMMLCGPHPASTTSEPRFVMNWYQVLSIDKEYPGYANFNPLRQRIVTLRGPQWPWQPAYTLGYADGNLSNDLCGGILRGAVAVHTRTFRFEAPQASGGVGGLGAPAGTGSPAWWY